MQRTQTRLYLGILFSPNQSTNKNARRTFRLGKPNREQEDAGQQKVLPKSLIPSEQDRCHPSQSTRLNHSKPLSRALWHGPTRMGGSGFTHHFGLPFLGLAGRRFCRLVYRVMRCFLIQEFPTDFGFSRGSCLVEAPTCSTPVGTRGRWMDSFLRCSTMNYRRLSLWS